MLVRDFTTTAGLDNAIRVTVGTRPENDAFSSRPSGDGLAGCDAVGAGAAGDQGDQHHVELELDGDGATAIRTGVPFFDHMLEQLGSHAGFDLS